MKYGNREICDVVFKANAETTIGSTTFKKGQPVFYFDTLKTSSLEGASTTVYATGGKGNARLIAWCGDRTLTLNMQDAVISPVTLSILAGAGLYDTTGEKGKGNAKDISVHCSGRFAYDSVTKSIVVKTEGAKQIDETQPIYFAEVDDEGNLKALTLGNPTAETGNITITEVSQIGSKITFKENIIQGANTKYIFVDCYVKYAAAEGNTGGMFEIDITPEIQSANFYIEGTTLWRDLNGKDHPAEIIIPNGRVQSNFTISMASTGDPAVYDFVIDAFPGYIVGDVSHKVLSAIQVYDEKYND